MLRYDPVRVVVLVQMVPGNLEAAALAAAGSSSGGSSSSGKFHQPHKMVQYLIWDDKHTAAAAAAATSTAAVQPPQAAAADQPVAAAPTAATTTSSAATAAAAKQLMQLPSLPIVNCPISSCPPDRDPDGLLRNLILNRTIDQCNSCHDRPVHSNRICHPPQPTLPQPQQLVPEPTSRHEAGQPAQPTSTAVGDGGGGINICLPAAVQVHYYASEQAVLQAFCAVVQVLDPDVLVGWDIQQGSLGYLADRGAVLGFNVLRAASRTPEVRPEAP